MSNAPALISLYIDFQKPDVHHLFQHPVQPACHDRYCRFSVAPLVRVVVVAGVSGESRNGGSGGGHGGDGLDGAASDGFMIGLGDSMVILDYQVSY